LIAARIAIWCPATVGFVSGIGPPPPLIAAVCDEIPNRYQ
jgi:hypothetical protein